jgi:hypothetical protein
VPGGKKRTDPKSNLNNEKSSMKPLLGSVTPFCRLLLSTSLIMAFILNVIPLQNGFAKSLFSQLGSTKGNVIFVNSAAQGENSGSTWENAFTNLQSALDNAQSGDEIWVAAGTYLPSKQADATDPRSATFKLVEGVGLYGGFTGSENTLEDRNWKKNPTILSGDIDHNDMSSPATNVDQILGQNAYQVVTARGLTADTLIDGFILTAGRADHATDVNGCSHECGGGLYVNGGNPTVANLLIQGNYADNGGGIMSFSASDPSFMNIMVQNNSSYNGGGMGVYKSNPIINESTFSDNSSLNHGGGLMIWNGSDAILTNTSVFNNMGDSGGGLFLGESNISLVHATVVNNLARIGDDAYLLYADQVKIKNSVIWGSSPENTLSPWNFPLVATFSDIRQPEGSVIPGEGNINSDPRLGESGNYGGLTLTIPLLPGSPAVDAVPPDKCTLEDGITPLANDQRGVARPQGKGCDMGAFEGIYLYNYLPSVVK